MDAQPTVAELFKGRNLRVVARRTGISYDQVRRYAKGSHVPGTVKHLRALAVFFGVSLDDLCRRIQHTTDGSGRVIHGARAS